MKEITKVKHWTKTKKGKTTNYVQVSFQDGALSGTVTESDHNGQCARAVPEFYEAFSDLSVFMCEMCDFSSEEASPTHKNAVSVHGVSIGYKYDAKLGIDRRAITLTGKRKLTNPGPDLTLNSPVRFDDHPRDECLLPDGCTDIVDTIIELADDYITNGTREQVSLFDNQDSDESTSEDSSESPEAPEPDADPEEEPAEVE